MFNYRFQNTYILEEKEGEYNFSMEKSDFFPLSHTPGDNTKLFKSVSSLTLNAPVQEVEYNRYYNPYKSMWSGLPLEEFRINFLEKVMDITDLKTSYQRGSSLRGYGRDLINISAHRLKEGDSQKVNDVTFMVKSYSTGKYCEMGGENELFYQFTFNTKYIEELQKAILQGKVFKAKWFTLFMKPEVPVLVPNGKPVLALRKHFLDPMREKGIDIVMSKNILEEIGYKGIEKETYEFAADLATTRGAKKAARLRTFEGMLLARQHSYKRQEDWHRGKSTELTITHFLVRRQGEEILNAYAIHINETYYEGVEMEDGMRRSLTIGPNHKMETWRDGEWSTVEGTRFSNPLLVDFSSYPDLSNDGLMNIIKTGVYDDYVKANIYGYQLDYSEGLWIADNEQFNSLYQIDKYRTVSHDIDALEEKPLEVYSLADSTTFYYIPNIATYATANDILTTEYTSINYTLNKVVHIMLSVEYIGKRDSIVNNDLIYFADEDMLYFKTKGLLLKVRTNHSLDEVRTFLTNSEITLEGDETLKELYASKLAFSHILQPTVLAYRSFLWEAKPLSDTEMNDFVVTGDTTLSDIAEAERNLIADPEPSNMENINIESHDF